MVYLEYPTLPTVFTILMSIKNLKLSESYESLVILVFTSPQFSQKEF